MKMLHRAQLNVIWLLVFFVAFMVMPLNKARALYPATVFEDAGVSSCNSFFSPGTTVTIFYAYISGPSPEDVASFTATGPSGVFNLEPIISSRERGLTYIHVENSVVLNGIYTFEITDSLGRITSVIKNFTYDPDIPQVDVSSMSPNNRDYVETTTPALSFDPVGSPGQFYYKVYLSDYDGQAFWYMSSVTQDTSFTVPEGLLLPNTAYTWYVRVIDSNTDPQNCHQSESVSFYTGTEGTPDLSTKFVTSINCPNFKTDWFGVRSTNVAPWDISFLEVTSPDSTVYRLDEMLFRFNNPAYYHIMNDSKFPTPDGSYDFEIEDNDGNYVTENLYHQYNPLWYKNIEEDSITPPNNTYFGTGTLNFSWNPLQGTGPYYYRVRVWDYNHKVIWYDSLPSEDTSVTIPVSGNFLRGNSYKWQLLIYDSDTQPDNMTASFQRTFTINLKELCECDLNNDGRCDMQDWLKFGEEWGHTDCDDPGVDCECDLNTDGKCDMQDWLKFGEDWGRTDCP